MRFVSIFPERRARLFTLGVAVLWVMAGAQPRTQTVFRTESNLVALPVTVVDESRKYVPDLRLEDFVVFEEGVPQTVSLFAAGTTPLDLMLLLDTSASMAPRLATVRQSAIGFVRALGAADRAAVVFFNSRVRIAQALTDNPAGVERVIHAAVPSGGTALYEALYIALKELARERRARQEVRRQAVVVLTDGLDNISRVSFEVAAAEARMSNVAIFAIVPPELGRSTYPEELSRVALFDISSLAEDTGGRAFRPRRFEDLSLVYGEIAEELKNQYWLAYVPTASAAGFRRLSVRIGTRPTLRARTRTGYEVRASGATSTPLRVPNQ